MTSLSREQLPLLGTPTADDLAPWELDDDALWTHFGPPPELVEAFLRTPTSPAPAEPVAVDSLSAREVLRLLEDTVRRRRATEVDDLLLVGQWADLHSTDPRLDPRPCGADGMPLPRPPGSERLVQVGGEGTPWVRDLSLCELAIARSVHPHAARAVVADTLDLRHRLPRLWAAVVALECEVWVARKVASLTRVLPADRCHVVDTAVTAALGHSPAKVLDLAAATVIEADPDGHAARTQADRLRRHVTLSRPDPAGMRHVIARIDAGDAAWVDAVITRVADILHTLALATEAASGAPVPGRDQLRAEAFTWLARPVELLTLLLEHADDGPAPDLPAEPDHAEPERSEPSEPAQGGLLAFPADLLDALRTHDLTALRPRAVLYLHLHEAALASPVTPGGVPGGVARVEGLGPVPLDHLADLLGGRPVTITPVLDLAEHVSTAAYEFPHHIRQRLHLLHHGDAFPHATTQPAPDSRRLDHDHIQPWTANGPPHQTSITNGQPLTRTTHRAKTHHAYTCEPRAPGHVLWRTPHGLTRLVDHTGTHHHDD